MMVCVTSRYHNMIRDPREDIERNGYTGGTFKLPVVVHGEQAWWDIKDHAALAQELKARVHMSPRLGPGG